MCRACWSQITRATRILSRSWRLLERTNISSQARPFRVSPRRPARALHQAEQIEEALRRGESVFVFPEGTFTAQSGLRPFHLGAFKAAIAAQREIVPIALEGTRRILRDGT